MPDIDVQSYELEVDIENAGQKVLRLDDIKKMPKHSITATIMCGGNRRSEMNKVIYDRTSSELMCLMKFSTIDRYGL